MIPRLGVMVALGAWLSSATAALAAPPQLTRLFPPGVARGATIEATATGEFPRWPVSAWVDRPGVEVTAGEKKGQLRISAAADAAPGIYWLRLYDHEGAAALRPLWVGAAPEVNEQEPNDRPGKPQAVVLPVTVNGRLEKSGDVDGYEVNLSTGQTLVAALEAHQSLGSPMDAIVQICWLRERPASVASGAASVEAFVVAENDDARGLDPLATYMASQSGRYLVRVFAFPATPNSSISFAGGDDYQYRLTLTADAFVDHALPLAVPRQGSAEVRLFGWNLPDAELTFPAPAATMSDELLAPRTVWAFADGAAGQIALPVVDEPCLVAGDDNTPATPQAIEWPVHVSGRLAAAGDSHAFRFSAAKGNKLRLKVDARQFGSPVDPVVTVLDDAGKQLAENDDASRTERDAVLIFTPPSDGAFVAVVRDLHGAGGLRYAYRLSIAAVEPDFALAVGDAFVLKAGGEISLPVTIDRRDGYDGEIEIAPLEAPPGVTAKKVTSPAKGDAAKTVSLKLTADPSAAAWQGPIGVVGQAGERRRLAAYNTPTAGQSLSAIWLTIVPAGS